MSAVALCSGCASLRLHDSGRLKTAEEAVAIVDELQKRGSGLFDQMEKNLDNALGAREQVDRIVEEAVAVTLDTDLPNLSSEDLLEDLHAAAEGHGDAKNNLDGAIGDATARVKAALESQKLVTKLANDGAVGTDLESVIGAIEKRIEWIQKGAEALRKAATSESDGDDGEAGKKVGEAIAGILDAPKDSERVKAATRSLAEAAQAASLAETERLTEFRRHLTELRRQRMGFMARHKMWKEVFPSISLLVTPESYFEVAALAGLESLPRCPETPDEDMDSCKRRLAAQQKHRLATLQDRQRKYWADDDTLLEFLSNALAFDSAQDRESGATAVAAYWVLALVEIPADLRAAEAVDVERHRHSIRLSEINADHRLGLVAQLTTGLQLYHQGGIKPEEVAQLLLAAGQVAALTFIGATN